MCVFIFRLLQHLSNARKTLDICVFSITSEKIANCVLKCHRKGVKIRIIADMAGADICNLSKNNVPVKLYSNLGHIHDKVRFSTKIVQNLFFCLFSLQLLMKNVL